VVVRHRRSADARSAGAEGRALPRIAWSWKITYSGL
jgi:hypothetical protein